MNGNSQVQLKSIKLWLILVGVITLLYSIYWYYNYDSYPVAFYDANRQRQVYLRNHTTAYPPPLTSFMDPPDMFNSKYINLENLL
jgi:hypothetical protein